MTRLAIVTLVTLGLAAACGKGDSKEGAAGAKGGEVSADQVAAINAALPAELKGKLEFEAGRIVENEKRNRAYKAAVPKGWKKGFMEGELKPADADNFGESPTLGKSRMSVGSNCDGTCEKKDWAAVSDKVMFTQFTGGKIEGKVIKDEKRATGRTLVFEVKPPDAFPEKRVAVYVLTAWWDPEGSKYHTCQAELGAPAKGAAAAFEKACSGVIVE
jgi:hypothetical protein